ncbi:MAG: lysine--tRNA ligase, partial [Erysipelotrichaceae bacterium]|nr:lysine--tRNA ligase [Erysipelotrichaceae bacterium]
MEQNLNDQQLARREKLRQLEELGIEPFGNAFKVTYHAAQLREQYGENSKEELEELNLQVSVAGRIMSKRRMGKLGFMHIQDKSGQIQIVVNKGVVGEDVYEIFKINDVGDIVGIEGQLVKTDSGELSVKALKYTHLSKSLRPLPEKFHGLTDIEERYRRRYVDLIMNEDSKRVAFLRPAIISCIRNYMSTQGF